MENSSDKKWGNDRATGIIIRDGKVLLIHRIKENEECWVFPGGTKEDRETIEQTLDREMAEEIGITVLEKKLLYSFEASGRIEHHFLVVDYQGEPAMGGPELQRMTEQNQYSIDTVDIADLDERLIFPKESVIKLKEFLRG